MYYHIHAIGCKITVGNYLGVKYLKVPKTYKLFKIEKYCSSAVHSNIPLQQSSVEKRVILDNLTLTALNTPNT